MKHLAAVLMILIWCTVSPATGGGVEPGEEDLLFEEDMGSATDIEDTAPKSPVDRFMDSSTFFLGYRGSVRTGNDPELINNHLFFRHTAESLFADTWFYRLDWRARLFLKSDHRAYDEGENLDADAHIREAYILSGHQRFSIKLGSQINAWGKADTSAVTDVLSPRDSSEFIFFKLEDARFGQVMASADIYMGKADLFVFFTPLPETDRLPDPGTHYYRPPAGPFLLHEQKPEAGDIETGFKLDYKLSKTEISVMAGRFYANSPVYEDRGPAAGNARHVHQVYPDYLMAGAALEHAHANFLFKLEAAFKADFPLQGQEGGMFGPVKTDLADMAAGLEYNANDAWLAALEISNRHIISARTDLVNTSRDSASLYFTYTRDFFHEILELEYNFYYHLRETNRFHNIQLTWDISDAIRLQARYTWLHITEPESLMWAYKDEDRAALELRYAF